MKNFFSGLEKFGLDLNIANGLFEEEKKSKETEAGEQKNEIPTEEEFLLLKSIQCPICDASFKTIQIKTGRVKRKEPDLDLRPRFEYVDTNKYEVGTCPCCGYTAMYRSFDGLTTGQKKLIREGFCSKFQSQAREPIEELQTIDYDTAIEQFKLALYVSIVKKGRDSEKAYICLKIAWLLRGKIEQLFEEDKEKNKELIANCKQEYVSFYQQAFDGFVKAVAKESCPIVGMDQNTVDLLIAAMAYNLGKYDVAARYVSSLLVSRSVGTNIKNRAQDLKEMILEKRRK